MSKPVVAAFDFDGTLTRRDTLLPFLRQVRGDGRLVLDGLALAPTLLGYGLRLIDNGRAKERVLSHCLGGMLLTVLEQEGAHFAHSRIPSLLRPAAMERLAWHQTQGHRCIVISASLELYVRPWAQAAGFQDVLATRLETTPDGRVTGRFIDANCYGAEKVRRLQALLGARDGYTLYAYGDSRGDRELLAYADHPYFREMPDR